MLVYDDTESVEKVKVFDHGVNVSEPGSFGEFQLSYRTGDIVSPHLDPREPLLVEAEHFVACVRTGTKPKTDGASGLRVVRALERAETSMRSNGLVVPFHDDPTHWALPGLDSTLGGLWHSQPLA